MTSTALVGFVGDIERFRSCRQFASYLGLTAREYSSGNRRRLGRISKRGDVYIRVLMVHGARSVLNAAHRKKSGPSPLQVWALEVKQRCGHNKAVVALANKNARRVWAIWKRNSEYPFQYQAA